MSADYSGWWSRSFRLVGSVWRQAALVQLLWVVPVVVAGAVAGFIMSRPLTELADSPSDVQPDWRPLARSLFFLIPLGLLTGLLALLASLTTLHLVVQAALGRPLSVRLALRTAAPRVPAYIGWGLLGGLLSVVGLLFCVLPAYYVVTVLTILPTVVLLERGRALARCFRLFHARAGDALARLATIIGLGIGISIVEQGFFGIAASLLGVFHTDRVPTAAFFAVSAVAVLLSAASQVVLAPMHVTAYADMRARYEPFSTAYLLVGRGDLLAAPGDR